MEDKKQDLNSLEELVKEANAYSGWFANLADELSKVLADIKAPDEEENTWEMKCPYKNRDKYFLIGSDTIVYFSYWSDFKTDKDRFKIGNTFSTKEAAELEVKRRNLLTRFRAFRDECNRDWKPVSGKQCKTSKFFIGYGWDSKDEQHKLKSLELGSSNLFHQFGYFKNREDCDKAIDLFGDEIKELFVYCEG